MADENKVEQQQTKTSEQYEAEIKALEEQLAKQKIATSNASSDASDWKHKYQATLSETERANAEREESDKAIREELERFKADAKISELKASYLALGYSEELALSTANAMYKGDTATVFANQKSFIAERDQIISANALKNMGKPPVGSSVSSDDLVLDKIRKAAGLI